MVAVLCCALGHVAASAASAQQGTTRNPDELWRDYPLEQTPKTAAPAPRPAAPPASPASQRSDSETPWILLLGIAAGAAVGILVALMLHRRQAAPERDANGAVQEMPPPAPERDANGAVQEMPPPAPERLWSVPAPEVAPGDAGAAKELPVCQVRWSRRASRFHAVTVDPDGTERRIARSPQFEWRGPSPPEQSPEAQAALRRLAKELRDQGWRPLRAKGFDFDERRWYARRFRSPSEAEDRARGSSPPRKQASGRPGPTRRSMNTEGSAGR
jgi:hypothetical protein